MHIQRKKLVSVLLTTLLLTSPILTNAQTESEDYDPFDAGFILSDQQLSDVNSMSLDEIVAFLNSKTGIIPTLVAYDPHDGLLKTVPMIIYDASQKFQVNPQVILAKLQKEQGLITNPKPKETQLEFALGYGACDSCKLRAAKDPEAQRIIDKYGGIEKQIYNAAEFLRYILDKPNALSYHPGKVYTIDGKEVLVKNAATSALYNYTPHIQGNKLFWKIYTSWFGSAINYPDGSLLQSVDDPAVWLIKNNTRYLFSSMQSLTTRYNAKRVLAVRSEDIEQYDRGPDITYPAFYVVRDEQNDIYLILQEQKRKIADQATLMKLGFKPDEIVDVLSNELAYFTDGLEINSASLTPLGSLLQDPETFGIYFVQDGIKYPLIAPELLTLNFENPKVRKSTVEELAQYEKSHPLYLAPGLLVKTPTDPKVYLSAGNGFLRHIDSEATFYRLGYKFTDIRDISESLMAVHTITEPVQLNEQISDQEINEITSAGIDNAL